MQALRAAVAGGRVGFSSGLLPVGVRCGGAAALTGRLAMSATPPAPGGAPGLRALATAASARIPVDGQIVDMNGCVGGWPPAVAGERVGESSRWVWDVGALAREWTRALLTLTWC